MRVLLVFLVALLSMSSAVSCTSPSVPDPPDDGQAVINLLRQGLPPLPDDKGASATTTTTLLGTDTYARGGDTREVGDRLDLISGASSLAWGIWQLSPGESFPLSVDFELSGLTGDGVYLAVADYRNSSWRISGPYRGSSTIHVDNRANESAAGNLYVAALTYGGATCGIGHVYGWVDDAWVIVEVDAIGQTGKYTSLCVVDGTPAISYYDVTHSSLKYAKASTSTGDSHSDWQSITVDNMADVGQYTSLALINGKPAISYYDATSGDLKYARSNTPAGTNPSNWVHLTVDSGGDVGRQTSLAEVDGHPAISYVDTTNNDIKYALSSSISGSAASDWQPIIIEDFFDEFDPEYYTASDTSLAVVAGNPAISYTGYSYWEFGPVWYARATTVDGASSADWNKLSVATAMLQGECSLAVIDGNPAIAFEAIVEESPRLGYVRATTATGQSHSDWPSAFIIPDGFGGWPSLAQINRKSPTPKSWPAIGSSAGSGLFYSKASTTSGASSSNWSAVRVGNQAEPRFISIADVDGRPAMSYYEFYEQNLYYAIRMGN